MLLSSPAHISFQSTQCHCQHQTQSHSGSDFLQVFSPRKTFYCLCESTGPAAACGVPSGPRSHTHNPWVTGGTKELSRCWEPRSGQSRLRCRCLVSFSPRMTFIFFPLLIPPFNPLLLSLPGSGHFRVFSSVCPHYPSPSSSILVSI